MSGFPGPGSGVTAAELMLGAISNVFRARINPKHTIHILLTLPFIRVVLDINIPPMQIIWRNRLQANYTEAPQRER
ncbi:hypothetical protein D3C85_1312770 [compost metagenome]